MLATDEDEDAEWLEGLPDEEDDKRDVLTSPQTTGRVDEEDAPSEERDRNSLTVADPPGGPIEMAPQLLERPRLAKQRLPARRRESGDLRCVSCGQGNEPSRAFCNRCGGKLSVEQVVAARWWKRYIPHRRGMVLAAGARPGQEGVKTKRNMPTLGALIGPLRVVAGVAGLTVAVIYGVHAPFREAVWKRVETMQNAVDRMTHPQLTPVQLTQISASRESVDHPAKMSVDSYMNTYWAWPQSPQTVTFHLSLSEESTIEGAMVFNGTEDQFRNYARPKQIKVIYPTGKNQLVNLKDTPKGQEIKLDSGGESVGSLDVEIISYYGVSAREAAFSEIELQTQVGGFDLS
ncbi:NADase-type glycan-binding domain-containing protein [Streptomyces sp. NPDC057910]|uniref:NADase-type glycan-binding domain-containing protein n=1 Tax=Streptomyces sp. NPDC057910 TaxID=3346278 RepID=UPI0036E10A15